MKHTLPETLRKLRFQVSWWVKWISKGTRSIKPTANWNLVKLITWKKVPEG